MELDQNAAIISYEEYHPFGTTSYRSGRTETEVSQKRCKYCDKEKGEESGLYYYGARYYAPWICRFVSVDPLQHKYPYYTPYQYAGNKPITYIDLDGLEEAKRDEQPPIARMESKNIDQIETENNEEIEERNNGFIDYYSLSKGKWIGVGWGNTEFGNKKIVLTRSLEKQIKKSTRKGNMISLTEEEQFYTPNVYNSKEIQAMDDTFTRYETSKQEEGFAVGILNNQITTADANGHSKGVIRIGTAYSALGRKSVQQENMLYDGHLHPAQIRFTGNSIQAGNHLPSKNSKNADLNSENRVHPKFVLGYNVRDNQDLITQSEENNARANKGKWIPIVYKKFPKMISFYEKGKRLSSMSYSRFLSINDKIINHYPNTHKKRNKILWN